MNSQELILGSVPQETEQPQRSDTMSSTAGKSMYGYVGLRIKGTTKTLETIYLKIVNSWPLI